MKIPPEKPPISRLVASPQTKHLNRVQQVRSIHVWPRSRNTKPNHRTASKGFQFSPATRPPPVAESAETIRISIADPAIPRAKDSPKDSFLWPRYCLMPAIG